MDKRKPYPSEQQDRFIVRFPDGMRSRIAEEAKKNNRSMNAEIVARLQESLAGNEKLTTARKELLYSEVRAASQRNLTGALAHAMLEPLDLLSVALNDIDPESAKGYQRLKLMTEAVAEEAEKRKKYDKALLHSFEKRIETLLLEQEEASLTPGKNLKNK